MLRQLHRQLQGPATEGAATATETTVRELYTKREHMVPMRDGVKLFVAVFTPKATSLTPCVLCFPL